MTFLIYLFLTFIAYGSQECPEVDLNSLTSSRTNPLANPSIRQTAGFCYAHAAADLVSATTGRIASPLHTALTYNLSGSPNSNSTTNLFREGGSVERSVELLTQQGWVATDSCVPTLDNNPDVLNFLYRNRLFIHETPRVMRLIVPGFDHRVCPRAIYRGSSNSSLESLASINEVIRPEEYLHSAINATCTGAQRISLDSARFCTLPSRRGHYSGDNPNRETIRRGIFWALRNESPVTFTFNTSTFDATNSDSDHATLITGSREINGVCHLIVRNYWNNPCAPLWAERFPEILCNRSDVPQDSFAIPLQLALRGAETITYSTTNGRRSSPDSFERVMGGLSLAAPACTR